jgi:putative phosphotransacetylase
MNITLEVSARHIHVTKEVLAALFGEGAALHNKRELSQPGQYLTEERVRVEGPRGSLEMSILGPERPATQVEISMTDARTLGLTAPVRESGDVQGSAPCRLVGPAGSYELPEGVIIAKRHAHLTQVTAEKHGFQDKSVARLKVDGPGGRTLVFGDVAVRVSPGFSDAVHLDTDESNAAGGIAPGAQGELIV